MMWAIAEVGGGILSASFSAVGDYCWIALFMAASDVESFALKGRSKNTPTHLRNSPRPSSQLAFYEPAPHHNPDFINHDW